MLESMDADLMTTILTICFSVLGILSIFGIHQARMFKKWRKIHKQNTWGIYRDVSLLYDDLKSLQQKIENNQNVSFELGKLTGHVQDMMDNQIRQIDIIEHITNKKIDKWIKTGKIRDLSHKIFFKKLVDR